MNEIFYDEEALKRKRTEKEEEKVSRRKKGTKKCYTWCVKYANHNNLQTQINFPFFTSTRAAIKMLRRIFFISKKITFLVFFYDKIKVYPEKKEKVERERERKTSCSRLLVDNIINDYNIEMIDIPTI